MSSPPFFLETSPLLIGFRSASCPPLLPSASLQLDQLWGRHVIWFWHLSDDKDCLSSWHISQVRPMSSVAKKQGLVLARLELVRIILWILRPSHGKSCLEGQLRRGMGWRDDDHVVTLHPVTFPEHQYFESWNSNVRKATYKLYILEFPSGLSG